MLPLIIRTGPGRTGIPVKVDSKPNGKQSNMNGHFWIRRRIPATYFISSLVESYLEEMEHRLKPATIENKRFIIIGKLLPYFGRLKVCDIDTIKIQKWQNNLISYRDENKKPFSQTYLKTVNN